MTERDLSMCTFCWTFQYGLHSDRLQCQYVTLHCVPKNRTRILWSITFTNIDQYQCHLTELFVQQYLIIYHKNYSHSRVPPATVTMATSTTRADQRLWYYSSPAHRVRATVEYLRHATPDFISPDVWPPNSPDLCGRLQNLGLSSRPMFIRSARATSTSWNSTWLMYGQTFGRQSLTGPSISGESGFRPLSVWKDAISNMSCKSSLFC